MRTFIQIIGTSPDVNTSPSFMITSDDIKVLFNAGEGFVHNCSEKGIKLTGLDALFGCGVDWRSWGGLGDLVYWQSETNTKTLPIYGPRNLIDLTTSFRYSLYSPNFHLQVFELEEEPVEIKKSLIVRPVPIHSSNPAHSMSPSRREVMMNPCFRDNIVYARAQATSDEERHELEQILARCETNLELVQKSLDSSGWPEESTNLGLYVAFDRPSMFLRPIPSHTVLSYIIQIPPIPARMDPKKAKELGVNGANLGKLSRGESVTVGDKVITPDLCWASAPSPGPYVVAVYCPDTNYLDSLVNASQWEPLYSPKEGDPLLTCIIHMTPQSVLKTDKYSKWMTRFPESAHHLILNRDSCNTNDSSEKFQAFFSNLVDIDPDVFYMAKHNNSGFPRDELPAAIKALNANGPRVFPADVAMAYNVVPLAHRGVANDAAAIADVPHCTKDRSLMHRNDDVRLKTLINEYQKIALAHRKHVAEDKISNDFSIYFLGTGAASASSLRNEAGIYVDIHGYGGMIMDCGSHSYTQIARKFGTNVKSKLKNLKLVWISHRHPDHNAGLLHILVERKHCFEADGEPVPPIIIIGPFWIEGRLLEYSLISRHQLLFKYYHNSLFLEENDILSEFFAKEMGIASFRTTSVWHCRDAFGSCLQSVHGWKISYSGDCRPTESFAELSRGADVMIHEATMCDGDRDLAVQKNHSSTCEVLQIAKQAEVDHVILTHFSRRQDSVPVADFVDYLSAVESNKPSPMTREDLDRAIIAFDMMTCHQSDLPILPKLLPSLCRLNQCLGK